MVPSPMSHILETHTPYNFCTWFLMCKCTLYICTYKTHTCTLYIRTYIRLQIYMCTYRFLSSITNTYTHSNRQTELHLYTVSEKERFGLWPWPWLLLWRGWGASEDLVCHRHLFFLTLHVLSLLNPFPKGIYFLLLLLLSLSLCVCVCLFSSIIYISLY